MLLDYYSAYAIDLTDTEEEESIYVETTLTVAGRAIPLNPPKIISVTVETDESS
jgi:hypothetical protein